MDKKDTNDYIDILAICSRFFRFIKVFWPAILLLAFMLTGAAAAVTLKPPTTTYSSHIIFTYGIKTSNSTEFSYSLAGLTKTADIDRVSTSIESILDTSLFKKALKKNLGTDTLRTSLRISFTSATNLGILYSESSNKEECVQALTSTLDILPDVLRQVSGPLEFHAQGSPDNVVENVEVLPTIPLAAAGFAAGLFLGIALLAVAAFTKREISSVPDVLRFLSLNVFGSLPFLNSKGSIPFLNALRSKGFLPRLSVKKTSELVLTDLYRKNLRLISTQIIEELRKNRFHSLLIMSTKAEEGKTVFAKNLESELLGAGFKVNLLQDFDKIRTLSEHMSDEELILIDLPGSRTSDLEIMEAADIADASLLLIKSDSVLPEDAEWGLHFLENCRAKCIGTVLNACI